MKSNEELSTENITRLKVRVCEYLSKKGDVNLLIERKKNGKSYTGNDLIHEINQNTEVGMDFINRLIILSLDLFSRQKENLPPSQNPSIEIKDTGGLAQYFKDVEKWENSFYCNECGTDTHTTDFHYSRSVANGDVYKCNNCNNEIVVDHKPNEDNY